MRPLNKITSCDSNNPVYSYLLELHKIAINFQLLSPTTIDGLKEAAILVGSQRVQRQGSNRATDPVNDDDEGWELEYSLLAPNQVAIVDNMTALQQFGREVFCAPQEEVLEGKCNSAYS